MRLPLRAPPHSWKLRRMARRERMRLPFLGCMQQLQAVLTSLLRRRLRRTSPKASNESQEVVLLAYHQLRNEHAFNSAFTLHECGMQKTDVRQAQQRRQTEI